MTQGHEDPAGGLPYVLHQIPGTAIYTSRLTAGLVTGKLKEHKLLGQTRLEVVEPAVEFRIGAFAITPFRVNHSIPDGMGFAIRPPLGTGVPTGALKFAPTPPAPRSWKRLTHPQAHQPS